MQKTPLIRLRGLRQIIPSGYVIGRASPGEGDAELIHMSQLAAAAVKTGIVPPAGGVASTLAVGVMINSFAGVNKNGYMPLAVLHKAIKLPAATLADLVTCRVAPTVDIHFTIVTDVATFQIDRTSGYLGTITVLAGQLTGTVAWVGSPTLLPRGTVIYLYMDPANGIDTSTAIDTTFTALEILLVADVA